MPSKQEIQNKLKNFKCRECGECCRQPGQVYIALPESVRIAEFLKIDVYHFVNEYCDLQDRQRLYLKLNGKACVFLKNDLCEINEVKPSQCREFPFEWRTPRSFEYCKGLR